MDRRPSIFDINEKKSKSCQKIIESIERQKGVTLPRVLQLVRLLQAVRGISVGIFLRLCTFVGFGLCPGTGIGFRSGIGRR